MMAKAPHAFGNPLLDAARRELEAIYLETGGTHDPLNNPNRHPLYLGAQRIFNVLMDQRGPLADEKRAYRERVKRFQIVKT
jgi:hypothetical protein